MKEPLRHMPRPCDETKQWGRCPFRVDAEPGEFSAERFEQLAETAGLPGAEAPVAAPMFACHRPAGAAPSVACAGWLAVCGSDHLGVRLAVADGRIAPEALARGADWPELFESYDVMAREQADGVYDPVAAAASRQRAGHNLDMVTKLLSGGQLRVCEPDDGCAMHAPPSSFEQGAAATPGARWR